MVNLLSTMALAIIDQVVSCSVCTLEVLYTCVVLVLLYANLL
jgi:hypothetical protein